MRAVWLGIKPGNALVAGRAVDAIAHERRVSRLVQVILHVRLRVQPQVGQPRLEPQRLTAASLRLRKSSEGARKELLRVLTTSTVRVRLESDHPTRERANQGQARASQFTIG
eukprot:SAG11_NODE_6413_length_1319_cov_1.120492_2_plen_111_part_01